MPVRTAGCITNSYYNLLNSSIFVVKYKNEPRVTIFFFFNSCRAYMKTPTCSLFMKYILIKQENKSFDTPNTTIFPLSTLEVAALPKSGKSL